MTPETFVDTVIDPALALLPARMDSPEARAMLVAIALQESGLTARVQLLEAWEPWWASRPGPASGPARGLWQFELGGGVAGVLGHSASQPFALPILDELLYPADAHIIHEALAHNDVLACVFARLLLYTLPRPLPQRGDEAESWRQYMSAWRPGKPHPSTWSANYTMAWQAVDG